MKKSKKICALLLAILMVMSLVPTANALDRGAVHTWNLYSASKAAVNAYEHTVDGDKNVQPNSTLAFYGPLKDAVQRGNPYSGSRHENIDNLQTAVSVLCSISGCPRAKYLDDEQLLNLANKLLKMCISNQYYIRTLFYSKDGDMYYYKYDYYVDAAHTQWIGEDYSFCYSVYY